MYPEIGSIGPLTLHSYGLLIALGVFLSLFLMGRAAARDGFPSHEKIFDLVFVVVFSGLLGARLFYVIQEWEWYRENPWEIFQIWKGGLIYYGGMTAGFTAFFLYTRLLRLPFLAAVDFLMPYIALTHAFGRIGCYLNGCCYGRPSGLPWAVKFPWLPGPVHPVQLYEASFNLLLFGCLVRYYPHRRFKGEITGLYLIIYPLGRFFLEFFRGDQTPWFFSLHLEQALSLLFVFLGISLYAIHRLRA